MLKLIIIFFIFTPPLIYAGVLIIFWIGLFRKQTCRSPEQPKVSIVIAARNEEKRLPALLEDLKKQTYPHELMEFLIADDHSEDKTGEIIDNYSKTDARFRRVPITRTEPGFTAKKNALNQTLRMATGEIILSTDADCRVLPTWVEAMVSFFTSNVGLVVGFSQFLNPEKRCSLFENCQAVDFLMLMSAAQGSAAWGKALAASGQNLAYRREVYDRVGGFSKIGHRVSGDDVLFLQLVRKQTKWKIRFASSKQAFNRTSAEPSFSAFLNQRKRWASNAAYQWKLNKPFFGYVMITFLTNLIALFSLPLMILIPGLTGYCLIAVGAKCIAEMLLFIRGTGIYGRRDLLGAFPAWFIFQIPYVVFIGILGSIGGFTWKERNHMSAEQK